ncbi:MAG: hypothetical protein Q8S73_13235 [Deltaproteobacteria bacterium]|nr:hypothetical protein [Myxococcales bacterium]MDP3215064.1 hypothetical protein [Deltaproteobacteria bacterium]
MDTSIKVELDGPEVSPASVDASVLLELSSSFLLLLRKLAEERGLELEFKGIEVLDKCAAVASHASQIAIAKEMALQAFVYIRSEEAVPRGTGALVDRVRGVLRNLPPEQSAAVLVDDWKRPLSLGEDVTPPSPWARTSMRVRVVRVGGSRPTVRCESRRDGGFSLTVSPSEARLIGSHLYKHVDIKARILRDDEGAIERGQLIEWQPVTGEDPMTAWREWMIENTISPDELDRRRGGT